MYVSNIKMLRSVFALLLVIGLVNCSPEQSTRKRALTDNQIKSETPQALVTKSAEALELEQLMLVAEKAVLGEMNQGRGQADINLLMQKVIIPLKDVVLNTDTIFKVGLRHSRTDGGRFIVPRLVSLFNEAIILVNQANSEIIARDTDVLAKYKKIIFWDCDKELMGSCEGLKFFRSTDSVNMGQIVKLIAAQETDEEEKYLLAKAGFEMKNRRLDADLRLMLLEEVSKHLSDDVDSKDANSLTQQELRRSADLFANILEINNNGIGSDDKTKAILKAYGAFELSRNVDSAMNPAMTNIVRLAAKHLLYKEDGKLSDEMKKEIIPSLLYTVGKDYEQGVEFSKANIRGEWVKPYKKYLQSKAEGKTPEVLTSVQKEVFPKIDASLGIDLFGSESSGIIENMLKDVRYESDDLDEYFFLAHQAFYGHYNLDDAAAFWAGTDKNVVRMMDELEKLIKVQIVNNIVLTNNRMNSFYNRNQNTKLVELLRESDKEASKIRKAWTKTIVRAESVKSFITRVVNPNAIGGETKEQYERINASVDALKKNIKFLVTYPNMFPLMHVMAKLEMKDTIRTWFGSFTIDSLTIIVNYFNGYFAPWFNFGNDGSKLDATEIIYTYFYALATQIFEIYSNNTLISPKLGDKAEIHKDFFAVVVKKMILGDEKTLEADKTNLFQNIESYKNNAKAMKRICDEEKELQQVEADLLAQWNEKKKENGDDYTWYEIMRDQGVMKHREEIKNQIAFVDIGGALYDGVSNRNDKIGSYIGKIYGTKPRGVFSSMRIEFPQKEMIARTVLDVFKNAKSGDASASSLFEKDQKGVSEIDKIFDEQFHEYNRLKAEYLKLFLEAESEIRECDLYFLNRARDIRHLLVYREAEELGKLFDQLWSVLSPLSEEERKALTSLSPESLRLEEIRKEFGKYTQVSSYSESVQPKFPAEYQERFGYNKITANQVTTYQMDTAARVYGYLHEMFPGQFEVTMPPDFKTTTIYKESSPDSIYFDWAVEDKEAARLAFVKSGVKAFANQMNWAGTSVPIGEQIVKTQILVDLYKLGELSKNPEVDCNDGELSDAVKAENCDRVTAAQILDHFEKVIDIIHIDDRDAEILDLLGKETKYDPAIYESFIKKKDEHRLYSYYDLAFKRIYSDASVSSAEEAWFSGVLIQFVNSVHKINSSTFVFPVPDYINKIFVDKYSEWLKKYYRLNKEFLLEIQSRKDKVEPFNFRYRIDRVRKVGAETNQFSQNPSVNLEPLVSDLIYGKFEGLSQKLNNDTSKYFWKPIWDEKKQIVELVKPIEESSEVEGQKAP